SALVASGTGAVAYVSGPSPAAADIAGGGVQAFVWTYTATDAGTVDWSGNASGTDANSGVPVSSAWTTSNQIEVLGIGPITKTVAPETVGAGQAVTYTIVITGSRQFLVITDTLSAGFTYVTNTTVYNGSPFTNPAVNGQTLSWNFGSPQNVPATLRFVATASSNPGIYYNDAGVTLVAGQVFTTGPTAPVTVGWPVFEIVASAGGQTIRVRVRMVNGLPVILSWEFLP
ncbi:MAG TPA: isopeptide-forming domain-containing fimbrial protein, partial [Anaerolineae bacterium]|nr:isopeptide-forming domain-containing fimbrial protein [Anaerolineae bacterium]